MLPKISNLKKVSDAKIYPEFEYKMNFDGCSKGNPGIAGAGAVIYHFDKEISANHFFVGDAFTNNHAEYAGLILGLQMAIQSGIKNLLVEGDSLLVINHMKGTYKCRSANLIELYDKAKTLEKEFESIEYVHVLRSNNKRADELSNLAIVDYYVDIIY